MPSNSPLSRYIPIALIIMLAVAAFTVTYPSFWFRLRPKGRFEGLGSWLAGAIFIGLLGLPALTAMGFETYFVARLLQNIAEGRKRLATIAVSVAWFVLTVALGMTLFMGVMGFGHGGRLSGEIYLALTVINIVFIGVGWLLSLTVRRRVSVQAI